MDLTRLVNLGVGDTDLLAVTDKGVLVKNAVDSVTGPSVLDDVDKSLLDVVVGCDEVIAKNGRKELRRSDRVLLSEN